MKHVFWIKANIKSVDKTKIFHSIGRLAISFQASSKEWN